MEALVFSFAKCIESNEILGLGRLWFNDWAINGQPDGRSGTIKKIEIQIAAAISFGKA
jgi:hypothetical protein